MHRVQADIQDAVIVGGQKGAGRGILWHGTKFGLQNFGAICQRKKRLSRQDSKPCVH
jgi:hypothetical protein